MKIPSSLGRPFAERQTAHSFRQEHIQGPVPHGGDREPMGATYERELKGILGGDAKTLGSVGKTLTPSDRAAYDRTAAQPFLVVRAAGSMGADLVAVRHDVSFLVEVKSSKEPTLYFTDSVRLQEQILEIKAECERAGVLPIYALRLKAVRGDAWRLFTLPNLALSGRAAVLARRLPKMAKTSQGNDVLRWEEGLPLARFLELVCSAPTNGTHLSASIPVVAPEAPQPVRTT